MTHASAHCGAGWNIAEGSFQMDIPGTAADLAAGPSQAAAPDQAGAPDQALVSEQAPVLAGGYPTDTQAASPDQTTAAVPVDVSAAAPIQAAEAKGEGQADLLFVQQATTAQLIFDDPNTATDQARLVLTGVSPATTWCARRYMKVPAPVPSDCSLYSIGADYLTAIFVEPCDVVDSV